MKKCVSRAGTSLLLVATVAATSFADANLGPIKEPPPRDTSVIGGTADTKFSSEWWKAEKKKFDQALKENNKELVVTVAKETVGGWRYSASSTYAVLSKAIAFLERNPSDRHNDLIALITARAEAAQYVLPLDTAAKDVLSGQVLCAPFERAAVYRQLGQDFLALQELEHFYNDGRAERERLANAPYDVPTDCPIEEKTVLVALIEAHLALALSDGSAPDVTQAHFRNAFDYNKELMKYTAINEVFTWGNKKVAARFVNNVWSVSNFALFLARQMHMPFSDYIKLTAEVLRQSTGPEPFSLDDSIQGKNYLEAEGASETQLWDFLQVYQEYFGAWPAGMGGCEYQSCALSRLNFAVQRKNTVKANAVIAELSGVSFADPALLAQFNRLQNAFQDILNSVPPELPMGSALGGIVNAMQTDADSATPPEDKDASLLGKAVTLARHNPVSLILLGITVACFITLIATRIRRSVVRKG